MTNRAHKVSVIGQVATGKTSLLKRITLDSFSDDQESTIGAGFSNYTLNYMNQDLKVCFWDTAGQERFHSLIPKYLAHSKVVLLVFSANFESSLEDAKTVYFSNCDTLERNVKWFLIGNKIDLGNESEILAQKFASQNNMKLVFCSAKTGENIDVLLKNIGEQLTKPEEVSQIQSVDLTVAHTNESCLC